MSVELFLGGRRGHGVETVSLMAQICYDPLKRQLTGLARVTSRVGENRRESVWNVGGDGL